MVKQDATPLRLKIVNIKVKSTNFVIDFPCDLQ